MSEVQRAILRDRDIILGRWLSGPAASGAISFAASTPPLQSYVSALFDAAVMALQAKSGAAERPWPLPAKTTPGLTCHPMDLERASAALHDCMLGHLQDQGLLFGAQDIAVLARFFHQQTLAHMAIAFGRFEGPSCSEHMQQGEILRHTTLHRQRLVTVLDVAKIGFFDWDMTNNTIEFSDQFQHDWQLASGSTFEQAVARIHEDDREEVKEAIQHAVDHHTPFRADYRVVHPDGAVVWVEIRGKVTYHANGTPMQFMGTSQDISLRIEQQKLAEKQQKWWMSLLHGLPLPIVLVEPGTGSHTFSNMAADAMFGRPIEKNTSSDGFGDEYFITDAAGNRLTAEQIPSTRAAKGETITNEEFIWHTDTGSYDLLFSAVAMEAMRGQPAVTVCPFQDVTELKKAQRGLNSANQDLKTESLLREKFVSALSHDMRTPLTAIRLGAQRLERKIMPFETVKQVAHRILGATLRMDKMIQNMLDASRIKAGEQLSVTRKVARLDQILQHEVDQLNDVHAGRVLLHNEAGELEAECDQEALQRVVDNLVNNAVKYGDPTAPVRVGLRQDAQNIEIDVHNEGPPISMADQRTLFEPYFRTASALEGGQQGWGIGLTLVHEIARAHGGHVAVSSALRHGTRFAIRFPLVGGPVSSFTG